MSTPKKLHPKPAGRKSKYEKIDLLQVERIASLGLTDHEIALSIGVSEATLNNYKKRHPEFLESIKRGKVVADSKVVASLYRRALGYTYDEKVVHSKRGVDGLVTVVAEDVSTKQVLPDPTSMIFWLKNRRKEDWLDTYTGEIVGRDGQPIKVEVVFVNEYKPTNGRSKGNGDKNKGH